MSLLLLVWLFVASAMGGVWDKQSPVRAEAGESLLVEQSSRTRVLLRVDPPGAELRAWDAGLEVPLQAGPDGTRIVPPSRASRELLLEPSEAVRLTIWKETRRVEPAAWDRYERALAKWARDGGEVPVGPADLGMLPALWQARREALIAAGEEDSDFVLACALYELELLRARGVTDHAVEEGAPFEVPAMGESVLDVMGPGVLLIDMRAQVLEGDFAVIQAGLERDGVWLGEHRRIAGADPEDPGWSWNRRLEVFIPPGLHVLRLTADEQGYEVSPSISRPRPSWRYADDLRRLDEEPWPVASLRAMEAAWVLGQPDLAERSAELLLTGELDPQAERLVRARLVRVGADPQQALGLWLEDLQDPLLLLAIAQRAARRGDVDASLLLPFAELLPDDPELLALLADQTAAGFLRPRGEAIRWLGRVDTRGSAASRWTSLPLLSGEGRTLLVSQPPGVARHRLRADDPEPAVLVLEAHPLGVPVVRLFAEDPVHYRLDGLELFGAGHLFEALEAEVEHTLEVLDGELLVLEADTVVSGGLRVYEQALAPPGSSWTLTEPGAPAEVAIHVYGGAGALLAHTDDGMTWSMRVEAPEDPAVPQRFVIPVGPWARSLTVTSDDELEISCGIRRTNVLRDRSLPIPSGDPLEAYQLASEGLGVVVRGDLGGRAIAETRLNRAGALVALGMRGSARAEANLVLHQPGATNRQREEAQAPIPPAGFEPAVGPAHADAALARAQVLPPLAPAEPQDWLDLRARLPERLHPWVYREASRLFLERNLVLEAFLAAEAGGELAEAELRRASYAGPWTLLNALDRDAGVVYLKVPRTPPGPDDGSFAQVREAGLGLPWPGTEVAVVRGEREDRLDFTGGGELQLELLCRDEAFRLDPPDCSVQLELNGVLEVVTIPDNHIVRWSARLPWAEHELRVRTAWDEHSATVVRASLGGELLPPVTTATTHRLGRAGAGVTVLGPTLVRVRVQRGGPVSVSGDGETRQVEDEGVLPVTSVGPVTVMVTGPSDALVTLARMELPAPEAEPTPPLDVRAQAPETPEPSGAAAWASWVWMNRVAFPPRHTTTPMGDGGTFVFGAEAGDDVTVFPTDLRHYQYVRGDMTWMQRLGLSEHWVYVQGAGRMSIDGVPGAGFEGGWVHTPGDFVLSADARGWVSNQAGHGRLAAELRYRRWVHLWWRAQPFLEGHAGSWSPDPGVSTDPLAWTSYHATHPWGLGAGAHLDWRRYKDFRLRMTGRGYTNSAPSLDWVSTSVRGDLQVSSSFYAGLGGSMELRFQDEHRAYTFWRPSVSTYLTAPLWRAPGRRLVFDARARYYPFQNISDVQVRLTLELSQRRGLWDHAPIDEVYLPARDLPLEQR